MDILLRSAYHGNKQRFSFVRKSRTWALADEFDLHYKIGRILSRPHSTSQRCLLPVAINL